MNHITTEHHVDASVALIELVNCDGLFVAHATSDENDQFSRTLFRGRWIDVREGHVAQCTSLQIRQHALDQGLVLRVNVRHAHQTALDLTARNVEQVLVLEQINVHAASLLASIIAQLLEDGEDARGQILLRCEGVDERRELVVGRGLVAQTVQEHNAECVLARNVRVLQQLLDFLWCNVR